MSENEKLKRCPFCGGEVTHKLGDHEIEATVFCLSCPVAIPTEIWQSRPIEDELQAEIDRLESIVEMEYSSHG